MVIYYGKDIIYVLYRGIKMTLNINKLMPEELGYMDEFRFRAVAEEKFLGLFKFGHNIFFEKYSESKLYSKEDISEIFVKNRLEEDLENALKNFNPDINKLNELLRTRVSNRIWFKTYENAKGDKKYTLYVSSG